MNSIDLKTVNVERVKKGYDIVNGAFIVLASDLRRQSLTHRRYTYAIQRAYIARIVRHGSVGCRKLWCIVVGTTKCWNVVESSGVGGLSKLG